MEKKLSGAEHVKRQEESGLRVSEYCRQNGIAANSFYSWRAKVNKELGFVKVSLNGKIELELSNGTKLFVSEESLSKVLGVLNAL